MTSTVPIDLEPSPSLPLAASPCSTGTENTTTCLPPDNNTPLKPSLILANLIPSLIVTLYILLIALYIWRSWSISTLARWTRYSCRSVYYNNKHNNGYVHIKDNEEDDLENHTDVGLQLDDLEQQPHPTPPFGPSIPLSDADEQLDKNDSNGVRSSVDLLKYFNPDTNRLKDEISNPAETKVDKMCTAISPRYQTGSWREWVERMFDKKLVQMQNWLEGGDWNGSEVVSSTMARNGEGKLRGRSAKGLENGEECGEIRRMLLKYAEEEDEEDGDEFELHRLGYGDAVGSRSGLESSLRTS